MEDLSNKKANINSNQEQDLSALLGMGLPPEALADLLGSINTDAKDEAESQLKKELPQIKSEAVSNDNERDLSSLMGMGLPPEALADLLGSINTDAKDEVESQLKKELPQIKSEAVSNDNERDLSSLMGMGLPPEALADLLGSINTDTKDEAESQLKKELPQIKSEAVSNDNERDLSSLMGMGLPPEALADLLGSINTDTKDKAESQLKKELPQTKHKNTDSAKSKKTNELSEPKINTTHDEEPHLKKVVIDNNVNDLALMGMGLPPEALMMLNAIKTTTAKEEEEQHLKKVVIENNKKDLSHLHGMGLPDEVIQTLRSIKSEDYKTEQAKSQAKEAHVAYTAKEEAKNKVTSQLTGMKFNPITGTFDVPKDESNKTINATPNPTHISSFKQPNIIKKHPAHTVENKLPQQRNEHIETANFDSLLNVSPPVNVTNEIKKPEEIIPKVTSVDNLDLTSLNKLADDLNKGVSSVNVSTTVDYNEQEKSSLVRSFQISEEGVFLGIILNITKKDEAIKILNNHCQTNYPPDYADNILNYDDKGITMYVEDDIVTQLEFKKGFDGVTSKGLKIGDNVSQALEIYGKPVMKTPRGAVWKNFKIFYEREIIHSIKIQR